MEASRPGPRDRLGLAVQRAIGRLLSLLWVPAMVALMRFGLGWRIEGMAAARREYRSLWGDGDGPLLVVAGAGTGILSTLPTWMRLGLVMPFSVASAAAVTP